MFVEVQWSVEKRVLKSLFVPVAIFIEDEDFARRSITEDQIWIIHVDLPHEASVDLVSIDLLQVVDVDIVSVDWSKPRDFMEDNLLSVREKLCMPAEELHAWDFSRHLDSVVECRHGIEEVLSGESSENEAKGSIVGDLAEDCWISLLRLVQVNAVLMGFNSGKSCMIIGLALLIAEERGEVPDGRLLKAKVQNEKEIS